MPRVSVLIPSYNHCRYVAACIESVLAQTYRDFEIIVVDDGSTDGSIDILRGYGEQITLIEQANQGTQAARNAAIAASSGEYLALLDSDDIWLPEKLERQIAELDQYPNAGLIYSFAYWVDEDGADLHEGGLIIGAPIRSDIPTLSQMLLENPVPALTAVFRRVCLDYLHGFDPSLFGSADWDMWLRISAQWDVICIPEPLAMYREHPFNTMKVLYRNKNLYIERCGLISQAMDRYSGQLSEQDCRAAWARTDMLGAQIEIRLGDVRKAGVYLEKALLRNPILLDDEKGLVDEIVELVFLGCGLDGRYEDYRDFVNNLFAPTETKTPAFKRLRRLVLSRTALRLAFSGYQAGDLAAVRSVLPFVIKADPRWLRNRGVWSIGIRSWLRLKG